MANTAIPWGPNAPLNVEIGVESTFDTATSNYLYTRQRGVPDIGSLHRFMIPSATQRGDINVVHAHVIGTSGALSPDAQITLSTDLYGLKGSAPSGTDMADFATDATGHPLALLADAFFGSETAVDVYDTLAAASHTVDLLTTTGDPAGLTLGGGVVVNTNTAASPLYEAAFLKTISAAPTSTIVPRVSLARAANAAGGQSIAGGITYYPAASTSKSLTMRVIGALVDSTTPLYLVLPGCGVDTCEIAFATGEIPTVNWGLRPTSYAWTDASGTGASARTWSYPDGEQVAGGRWMLAGSAIRVSSGTISLSNGLRSVPSAAAAHGRAGWIKTGGADGIGTCRLEIAADETIAQTLRAAYYAQTTVAFQGWQGSGPGRMWAVAIPAAHISEYADPVENDGRYFINLTLRPQSYTGDTGTASECGDRPLYFWLG